MAIKFLLLIIILFLLILCIRVKSNFTTTQANSPDIRQHQEGLTAINEWMGLLHNHLLNVENKYRNIHYEVYGYPTTSSSA